MQSNNVDELSIKNAILKNIKANNIENVYLDGFDEVIAKITTCVKLLKSSKSNKHAKKNVCNWSKH